MTAHFTTSQDLRKVKLILAEAKTKAKTLLNEDLAAVEAVQKGKPYGAETKSRIRYKQGFLQGVLYCIESLEHLYPPEIKLD